MIVRSSKHLRAQTLLTGVAHSELAYRLNIPSSQRQNIDPCWLGQKFGGKRAKVGIQGWSVFRDLLVFWVEFKRF